MTAGGEALSSSTMTTVSIKEAAVALCDWRSHTAKGEWNG